MLLEKSNNYSGTLLFHAAGIVDEADDLAIGAEAPGVDAAGGVFLLEAVKPVGGRRAVAVMCWASASLPPQ